MSKAIKIFFSIAALAGLAAAVIAILSRKQPRQKVECEGSRVIAGMFDEDDELIGVGILTTDNCNN